MAVIGPTFFSSPVGDHPPGDGLTLFQTTFAGGSKADVSSYAIGSGATTDPAGKMVASDGNLQITQNSSDVSALVYNNASFDIQPATSWTLEVMFTVDAPLGRPAGANKIMQFGFGSYVPDVYIAGESPAGVNQLYTFQSGPTFVYSNMDIIGHPPAIHHFALVARPPGPNWLDMYLDGVRVAQNMFQSASGSAGNIQLGASGVSGRTYVLNFKGVRVRAEQVYPDSATITPPLNPAAWGPP